MGVGAKLLSAMVVAVLSLAGCGGGGGGSGGGGSSPGPVTGPPEPPPPPPEPPPPPPPAPSSPFTVNNPFAVAGAVSVDQVRVDDLRVFGDSYSQQGFGGTTTWTMALRDQGTAARTEVYAIGGAGANSNRSNSLEAQINNWQAADSAIGNGDLTVLYMGYNDLLGGITAAKQGYLAGVDRLVDGGAAADNRRLFVTMLHDSSRNPRNNGVTRQQVGDWNSFVAGVANSNDKIIAVDLFTAFDRIYERPGDYGLANVTTVDAERSATDALYFDDLHFGSKGQELIARVYRHYLTRGWDWANSISAGSNAAQRLRRDLDDGLLALDRDGASEAPTLGFSSFALGNGGIAQPFQASSGMAEQTLDGPSRAAFAETYRSTAASGGVALDYRLAQDRRFGLAISRYDAATESASSAARLDQDQSSDAVALYWQQAHGGIHATTQFAFLQHEFTERAQDDQLGQSGVTRHAGQTWALDQKLARPTRAADSTLTPWASLSYQSHELAPYEAKSLYTSNVRFSGATATDVMGSIGLDLRHDAIALGAGRQLWLSGRAAYALSFYRDDVEVTMSEAAMPGLGQRETIERQQIERFDLSLDAVLGLAQDLHLRAGYGLTADRAQHDQRVRVSLDYRF